MKPKKLVDKIWKVEQKAQNNKILCDGIAGYLDQQVGHLNYERLQLIMSFHIFLFRDPYNAIQATVHHLYNNNPMLFGMLDSAITQLIKDGYA